MSTPTPLPLDARIRQWPLPWRWALAAVLLAALFGPMVALMVEWWRFYLTPQGALESMLVALALAGAIAYATRPYHARIRANMAAVPGNPRWGRPSPWVQFLALHAMVWCPVAFVYGGAVRWTAVESHPQYTVLSTDSCRRRCNFCQEQFEVEDWPGTPLAGFCAEDLPSTLRRGDRVRFTVQANDRAIYVHDIVIVPRSDRREGR